MEQTLVVLHILHQDGSITTGQAIRTQPSMLQQMALGLDRLLITHITTFYTGYI
jgi:hypothetical protein